jgi:hypothetical protein
MKRKTTATWQLRLPLALNDSRSSCSRSRSRSRRLSRAETHNLKWPPRKGDIVYFQTGFGIEGGVLREIRQGLVWVDYILDDGQVVPEHHLVMRPAAATWRDPDTVTETERLACVARIKATHEAGLNLKEDPDAWADFLQFFMYTLLQVEKEQERKAAALLSLTTRAAPS